jgi:hypothetical protein
MTQTQITNHKSDNLLKLIGSTGVLPESILKFRHLKYMRSEKNTNITSVFNHSEIIIK